MSLHRGRLFVRLTTQTNSVKRNLDRDVVHVVHERVVCVPQKTHAPLAIKVDVGLLRSAQDADYAASIRKRTRWRSWASEYLAKVRVAGSNPVVRSRCG